ncbi:MAG: hypothetical protein A7316_06780 [Candidatus Altiarchaeales archaeon WOR_SM1_86-2]|nr:MAG: hypothetical protein A7316_06780 [Candidatus Altiarchaeales archaeon WOR_SM1_86-2]ODS41583.1 MAG: hypothetical protein A7315_01355 [Candidatus Altiarchaeales archaeon WOR_SM1_79]
MENIKLTTNAGKIPDPPEELVLRIRSMKNPSITEVIEEIERYRQEKKREQTARILMPTTPCRLTI